MGLSPGVTLGPYEILAPLGAGAMGEVYRASDPRLRREVAIKVLPAAFAADPGRLRRFEQEALAAASLNHPNILAVYDLGVHDGAPYIVSELLDGTTLREAIGTDPLPARSALDYATQIARGLAAAHDKGIVHRDLKPENLFLTRDGRIKILDFGLAKLTQTDGSANASGATRMTVAAGTEPGMIVGTVGYMSPEQVRGEAADHRSDIFAFAVILYEMLTGRRAFHGPSAVETMHAILKQDPLESGLSVPGVAPAIERIIRRCLEKNPEQRFQSARDLAFNLEAAAAETTSSIVGRASAEPATRRRSATATLLVPVAVGLALAAGAGFFAARRLDGEASPTFTRLTFRRGTVQSARFAPDGQTVVYSAAWQGNPLDLFSTRIGSVEVRALEVPGARIESVSSKGDMALRLANGTLARAPLAGGAPREIIERVVAAVWAPDGETLAIVRTGTGRRRLEFPPGVLLYETAGSISDIAVSPDGASVAYAEAPPGIGPVLSIGVIDRSKTRKTLSSGWRAVRGLTWSPRGDEIWFAASKTLQGAGTVYALSLAGRLRDLVKAPGDLFVYDARPDGKVLLGRSDLRLEARGLAPGEDRERDFSWLDRTGISDLSSDGRSILITEDGAAGLQIFLRKTDAASAIRLGDGGAFGQSPDGRSVVFQTLTPLRLGILPIGPGETRFLTHPGFDGYSWATWFPDGKRILFAASEPRVGPRLYVEDVSGGGPRAIAPEGTFIPTGTRAVSPDGTRIAAIEKIALVVLPAAGGPAVPVPGLKPGDLPSGWSDDGRFLYVYRREKPPVIVYRVEPTTGRKERWKEIGPPDPSGVTAIGHVMITPDGRSYVYNYARTLSDLYLVEGLK